MKDDLKIAYWMKERAELLLSNLKKEKAEGTITKAEYETLKPEYVAMLNDALPLIDSIKAKLKEELVGKEKELERLEKQLSLLKARHKVGEITSGTYREKGKPVEVKVKGLQSQISELEALIGSTSSADIGGPKVVTPPWPWRKGLGGRINVFLTGMLKYLNKLQLMSSKFFARFKTIGKIAKQRPFITSVISICILGLATWGLVVLFNGQACPKIGDRAPDFSLKTIDGEEMRLSDFRGNILVLYFWNPDCPPCVQDITYIQTISNKWAEQNLVVLTINEFTSSTRVKEFMTDGGLTLPVLLDREGKVAEKYCLIGVPVTIFINSEGIIEDFLIGGWAYRNEGDRQKIISEIGSILNEIDHSQKFDWTPPTISNISVSSITESSAIINWTTDEPATSQVIVNLPEVSFWTECDETLVTYHSVNLTNLEPNTKCEGWVVSYDDQENAVESEFQAFITRGTGSVTAETGSEIGKRAPNFILQSIDGKTITLNDLRGKKVILNFWISTCSACDSEMDYIQEIYRKYPKSEIAILAVNVREDPFVVSSYAQRKGLSFNILLDSEGKVDQIYQPELFPCTFFIGTDGFIREIKSGAFTSLDEIESIINQLD